MLSVMFGIMKAADTAVTFFSSPYVEAKRQEKHEEWGVTDCARQVTQKGPMIDLNLHPVHNLSTFRVEYLPHDPVAIIVGYTAVYLTPREAEYISMREDDCRWADFHTVQVLRFIRSQQPLRAQFYNANRNV